MKNRIAKYALLPLTVILIAFGFTSGSSAKDTPPEVQPFLPEIVSLFPDVRDVAISPDRQEIYFTIQSYQNEIAAIVFVTFKDGTYSKPQVASFSGRFGDMEPVFSADGLRLYFVSNRPIDIDTSFGNFLVSIKDYDIWYVERKTINDAWSAPVNMGAPVNSKADEFYPSFTKSGNLFFTCVDSGSTTQDDIYMCTFTKGKYQPRARLSDSINTEGPEFNAFVAPDESYLVYTSYKRPGDAGSGDLYISWKKNEVWTTGKNIGREINSPRMEYCPFVDTKNGILYFTSRRNSVNTTFDSQQTLEELLQEMSRYENGQSRLYQVKSPGLRIE